MASPPYSVTVTISGTSNVVAGYAGDDYIAGVKLYYSTDGLSYTLFRSLTTPLASGDTFSYADGPIPDDVKYYYYATGMASAGETAASNVASVARWTETITILVNLSPTQIGSTAVGATESVGVGVGVTTTTVGAYAETVSASVTTSVTEGSAQTIRNDYAHYLGDVTGKVHTLSAANLSFNGASINSYWTSKITDFSELDLSLFGKWKSIYWAKVKYVDKSASTPVILSVSVDNGAWSPCVQQSIGAGDGGHKDAYFHMVKTGKYFQFRVEWPSTDKTFQFTGLEIAMTKGGDEFKI
jgi:hypothetical protein